MLEIAIFARENNKKLALLLEDISQQNFTNCEVFLYMDKYITETQHTSTEDSVISTTTVIETP